MTTEFGYTEHGEYLPIVAEPFLHIVMPRDDFEDASREEQEAMSYIVRAASRLRDRWTVRQSYVWDALILECWIGRS